MVSVVVRVVDYNTGRPVGGALVRVGGSTAVTDAMGRAMLDVPAGSYVIRVSRSGYRLTEEYVSITGPSEVTVRLIPSVRIL
mgnify:CR=1 FL=1